MNLNLLWYKKICPPPFVLRIATSEALHQPVGQGREESENVHSVIQRVCTKYCL
jgi:hypothetical protein